MDYREAYELFKSGNKEPELAEELLQIADNDELIREKFTGELEFGTGGMRGKIGAGTVCLNRYTLEKATQGLANAIKACGPAACARGVAISYDSRHYSRKFAEWSAGVLAANRIKAYVYSELRPTPVLSYTVRKLNCIAGIMITASHNPPMYNGYKIYWEDGCQTLNDRADVITAAVNAVPMFTAKSMPYDAAKSSGFAMELGVTVVNDYISDALQVIIDPKVIKHNADMPIVYTPLYGTGADAMAKMFAAAGFRNVTMVMANPDPDFGGIPYPNPEDPSVFEGALPTAEELKAPIILAADPDADRLGIMVRTAEGYKPLNGNQTGALLCSYVLSGRSKTYKGPGFMVKTIVTSPMTERIAEHFGVKVYNTLTGFKYIGEKIGQLDDTHREKFLFGFEESYGYLAGTMVRDKDSISSCLLAAEMTAWYASRGMNLFEGLEELYKTYGYYKERVFSIAMEGLTGMEKLKFMMKELRNRIPSEFGGSPVSYVEDYLTAERRSIDGELLAELDLPSSNVVKIVLENGCWLVIRPSGTEPKVKQYISVCKPTAEACDALLDTLESELRALISSIIG